MRDNAVCGSVVIHMHIGPIAHGNSIIADSSCVRGRDNCAWCGRDETLRLSRKGECLKREPFLTRNASLGRSSIKPLPCPREECEYAITKHGSAANRDNSYRRVPVWSALIRHEPHHTDSSGPCSCTIHALMQPCRALAVYICFSVFSMLFHHHAFFITKPL